VSRLGSDSDLIFRNIFFLFQSQVLSTIITVLSHIFIVRYLGSLQYGLVSQVVILVSIIGVFRYWGVNTALTKYLAEYRKKNQLDLLQFFLFSGLFFEIIIGVFLSLVSYFFSSYYSHNLINQPELEPLLQIYSFTILFQCIYEYSLSVFIGYEKIKLYSYFTIVFGLMRSLLPPILVYCGYGLYGAILGNLIPLGFISCISIIVVIKKVYYYDEYLSHNFSTIMNALNTLVLYGIPLFFKNIVKNIGNQINTFVLSIYVGPITLANYNVAKNYEIIYTNIASPISNVLFPTFSKFNLRHNYEDITLLYKNSIFYTSLLIFPITFGIAILSKHLVFFLYGDSYQFAIKILNIIILNYLSMGLGSLTNIKLLESQGDTKFLLKIEIIRLAKIIILIPVIVKYNLIIYLLLNFILTIPISFYEFYWIKYNYNITNDWISIFKIFFSSLATSLIVNYILNMVNLNSLYSIISGFFIYITIYLIFLPLIGAINYNQVNYIENNLANISIISHLYYYPGLFVKYIIKKKKEYNLKLS